MAELPKNINCTWHLVNLDLKQPREVELLQTCLGSPQSFDAFVDLGNAP